jgi:hypothetical protein
MPPGAPPFGLVSRSRGWPRAFLGAQGDGHRSRAELPLKPDILIIQGLAGRSHIDQSPFHRPRLRPDQANVPSPLNAVTAGDRASFRSPYASAASSDDPTAQTISPDASPTSHQAECIKSRADWRAFWRRPSPG